MGELSVLGVSAFKEATLEHHFKPNPNDNFRINPD
jgi:hypothetical protein